MSGLRKNSKSITHPRSLAPLRNAEGPARSKAAFQLSFHHESRQRAFRALERDAVILLDVPNVASNVSRIISCHCGGAALAECSSLGLGIGLGIGLEGGTL